MRKAGLMINKSITHFKGYYQVYDIPAWKLPNIKICESRNLYSLSGVPGSQTILDVWEEKKLNWVCKSYKNGLSDIQIIDEIPSLVKNNKIDRALFYLCEYDAFGHANATHTDAMLTRANEYAIRLQNMIQTLDKQGRKYKINLISDHGMVPKKGEVDVRQALEKLPFKDWVHYWAILDSTMARFYINSPKVEEAIKEALSKLPGQFLTKEDEEKYKIRLNGDYGNVLWLINTGLQIVPSDMGRIACKGMHGYEPTHDEMLASFASTEKIHSSMNSIKDYFYHAC
jgi:CRISPR/Cas system Type II protein with McrA/HNH and RuvC-like nuclease domain